MIKLYPLFQMWQYFCAWHSRSFSFDNYALNIFRNSNIISFNTVSYLIPFNTYVLLYSTIVLLTSWEKDYWILTLYFQGGIHEQVLRRTRLPLHSILLRCHIGERRRRQQSPTQRATAGKQWKTTRMIPFYVYLINITQSACAQIVDSVDILLVYLA